MFDTFQELMSDDRREQGYVIVLPGIEGKSFFNKSVVRGLVDANVPYAIEIDDWTYYGKWTYIYNLRSQKWHHKQAARIAQKIVDYQKDYPNRPIYLIGHSGGGALSLLILEHLPAETTITGALLLGVAVSCDYDVSQALQAVDHSIWNFTSKVDLFYLAFGTIMLGTADGKHALCAGINGFRRPPSDIALRSKLIECPYRKEYFWSRHFAGHFGPTARPFVTKYLAPIVHPASAAKAELTALSNVVK